MKKILMITVLMVFSLTIVLAQEESQIAELKMDKFDQEMDKFEQKMEKMAENLAEESGGQVTINVNSMNRSKVYLGVFPKDLTLEDVRELGYDLNYGVLISGIVPGSSASRQKLFTNDIIYEIDGRKVTNDKAFTEILQSYNPGDVVEIKLFSAGKYIEKDFTFEGKTPTGEKELTIDTDKKKEVDWNSIAINWIPRYYQFDDIEDINGIVQQMSFEEIDDDGLFMNGFGFRIHAGGGFYIGGEWSWYETDKKINKQIFDASNPDISESVTRKMEYSNSFGGVTLDKRIYFTKYFQPGIGFLLGAGTQKLNFSQNNGDYNWTAFEADFNDSVNNSMSMTRDYVVFQPRADLYIPILSWFGVRGEAAYMLGYSPQSGWQGGDYGITQSPSTKCDGLTFSVGPWIEF